jgi:TIR domain
MIVLSHAPEDLMRVERFYRAFHEADLEPWMDSRDRPPGALWERALSFAIERCSLLVIFLSKHSVDKWGLPRTELIKALSDWDKKEADNVYVVLVRLEACKIPQQLEKFQKFEALDDSKELQLVRLLRVLHGKARGILDFLPDKVEYKLRQILQENVIHCDIGVTIPEFHTFDHVLFSDINSLIEGRARDILEAFLAQTDSAEKAKASPFSRKDGFWLQPTILTATRPLISVEFYISTYIWGTTHRNHYTRSLNIDVENSAELTLKDVVKDQATATKFFSKYCEAALIAQTDFRLAIGDWAFDPNAASTSQCFGFRNADLLFIFAPREVAGHAFGRKVVELPFNDVYRILTDRIIDLLIGRYDPADGGVKL